MPTNSPAVARGSGDHDQARFLVVEDDQAMRNLLLEVLLREGYECECAATCAEGRDLFEKGKFACAFVDIGLPDGNGLTLLGEFVTEDPCLVAVVLTGDISSEAIIGAMRGGAFDYLAKPIDMVTLKAAISRALAHHTVASERADLFRLLLEEREQLRAKVEVATSDIRQYAKACELSNARLRGLLQVAQLSNEYISGEQLFRESFLAIVQHVPLRALAMCDGLRKKLLLAIRAAGSEEVEIFGSDGEREVSGYDSLLAQVEPGLLMRDWLLRRGLLEVDDLVPYLYPQGSTQRAVPTVGFYLAKGAELTAQTTEFLDTCANFLTLEWERTYLMLYVAHHASLGNIAVELARSFIQPLTAIQTAADFVNETVSAPDGKQGLAIITQNVDRLRRQTQEFRKLSAMRQNAVETVRLDEYADQALDMLSVAIQNRGVTVHRDYITDCECVLLNGTALARTFLDLLLSALRSVEIGGNLFLRLLDLDTDHVAFEISYTSPGRKPGAGQAPEFSDPAYQLSERTIHSCGGSLNVEFLEDRRKVVRIVLPRNATRAVGAWESIR